MPHIRQNIIWDQKETLETLQINKLQKVKQAHIPKNLQMETVLQQEVNKIYQHHKKIKRMEFLLIKNMDLIRNKMNTMNRT